MAVGIGRLDSAVDGDLHAGAGRKLFIALLVLLAWAPIPIGSNRLWSLSVLEAASFTIVGVWALGYAYQKFSISGAIRDFRFSLYLFATFLCLPLIQLVPLPAELVRFLSRDIYEHYLNLPAGQSNSLMSLSLDRDATLSGFLRQSALTGIFFAVIALVTTRKRIHTLLVLFYVVGFAEAVYGLLVYFGGGDIGLWNPGNDGRTVSGTYVNQNHFSGLMEITIAAGMGLMIMRSESDHLDVGRQKVLRAIVGSLLGYRGTVLFGLLVMFSALILSSSRGAIGSLAAALAIAAAVALVRRKRADSPELKMGLTAIVLAVLSVAWLGTGQLSEKLASSGLSSRRADLRELSYRIIADYPLTGSGLGTYRWVLPKYKDERFGSGFYEHAHNDYLEIIGEQGLLGFSLLVAAIGLIAVRVFNACGRQQDPLNRGALFACAVGCISLSLHGLVDFNFQIPANAAYFCALLGVGAAATSIKSESRP